jgi:PIN domain nuclease of toxin-antitoxin system
VGDVQITSVLLDTCSIIFWEFEADRLSLAAHDAITNLDTVVYVSAASIPEIACAAERRRIALNSPWVNWWDEVIERNGWNLVPVDDHVLKGAFTLPEPIHKDPIDRILIATARLMNLTLITTDQKILDYPHVQTLR